MAHDFTTWELPGADRTVLTEAILDALRSGPLMAREIQVQIREGLWRTPLLWHNNDVRLALYGLVMEGQATMILRDGQTFYALRERRGIDGNNLGRMDD